MFNNNWNKDGDKTYNAYNRQNILEKNLAVPNLKMFLLTFILRIRYMYKQWKRIVNENITTQNFLTKKLRDKRIKNKTVSHPYKRIRKSINILRDLQST